MTTLADRLESDEVGRLNAVLAFDRRVLEAQSALPRASDPGPLAGVTVAVKDNLCTVDYPTTCASRLLAGYRSPFDATAVARLRAADALIVCKTNMDEFAMGSSTEHSAYGRVVHPLDEARVPGGSSGGSAALVATEVVDTALGSETGGSVRQPASFCGVVGLKPGYGRVSRYGLVAFGSSLDQIGVFARSVRDAGRVLSVISGPDANDATALDREPVVLGPARSSLHGVTVGVPQEYFPADLDPSVKAGCERAIRALHALGAEVRPVNLPHTRLAIPTYYVIAPAEASANLARYDGVRYGQRATFTEPSIGALYRESRGAGFGPEVRRRIILGTYVLSAGYYDAYYGKAQVARRLIADDFRHVFADGIDLLFTPTTPTTAFLAGAKSHDPVAMFLADVFTCPVNLAGLPAVSIPIGRAEGLPVGGQLIAPPLAEAPMLVAAEVLAGALEPEAEVR